MKHLERLVTGLIVMLLIGVALALVIGACVAIVALFEKDTRLLGEIFLSFVVLLVAYGIGYDVLKRDL